MDFEMMIEKAQKDLEKNSKNQCYATVLLTDKGNIYFAWCNTFNNCCEKTDDDFSIIKELIEFGESRILKMVSVFKHGEIIGAAALPCFEICQMVYDMNNDNINTEIRIETVDPSTNMTRAEIIPLSERFF